jgi:uncharacterized membrane protein YhaH (DUF805 family)
LLNKILQYYVKELDIVGLSIKHYKWSWKFFWFMVALSIIMIVNKIINIKDSNYGLILIITTITILLFVYNNKRYRLKFNELFEEKFKIKVKDYNTSREIFSEIKIHQMINFLKSYNLNSQDKVKLLIEMIKQEIERRMLPVFFLPGLFLAMFIPIWSQLVRVIFDANKSPDYHTQVTVYLVLALVIIVPILGMYKNILYDLKQTFIDREISKLKELLKLFQEILLRI